MGHVSGQLSYGHAVPPARRAAPQRSVGVPDDLWAQAWTIAEKRNEADLIGRGVAAVIRQSLRAYVKKHRALLEDAVD